MKKSTSFFTVNNGEQALEVLNQKVIDLIVSDILMPKIDGFRLCFLVKSNHRFAHIPFVFYSANYKEQEAIDFARNIGADKYLVKPVDSNKLVEELSEIVLMAQLKGVGQLQLSETEFLMGYSVQVNEKLNSINEKLYETNINLMSANDNLAQTKKELLDARKLLGVYCRP
ncbi:response regulator [Methylocucumis oryzae]|uniref:Response regulatory domain-containing protein n=1 Tax=Methylocucumis oryzae TaxID=1632867 RepID=A0A0F3IHZ7_9GAMM|nr:response regulator [Methylocucumis oryzae]KJV05079.1 hypothetical protein VZ94_20760 [Methylocucumis oryzae]